MTAATTPSTEFLLQLGGANGDPQSLAELSPPPALRLLVLAPHPDDFDEVAVTMRYFFESAAEITLGVLTGGASGVLDSFVTPGTDARKVEVRETEQAEALDFFGLPPDNVVFLRLPVSGDGELRLDADAREALAALFHGIEPDIVILPHGNDTNAGHRRTFATFRELAATAHKHVVGMYQRDPKTISMRLDVYLPFDETEAQWKRQMLRCHRSQQARNRQQRGSGLDDRILELNGRIAVELHLDDSYAEGFQVELFQPRGGNRMLGS